MEMTWPKIQNYIKHLGLYSAANFPVNSIKCGDCIYTYFLRVKLHGTEDGSWQESRDEKLTDKEPGGPGGLGPSFWKRFSASHFRENKCG